MSRLTVVRTEVRWINWPAAPRSSRTPTGYAKQKRNQRLLGIQPFDLVRPRQQLRSKLARFIGGKKIVDADNQFPLQNPLV
jgi:hypothetical protein